MTRDYSKSGEAKFSYDDFVCEERDDRVDVLIAELESYVAGLVQPAVEEAFKTVVERLNGWGHELSDTRPEFLSCAYYDLSKDTASRLRLAIDVTISAGFEPHESIRDVESSTL